MTVLSHTHPKIRAYAHRVKHYFSMHSCPFEFASRNIRNHNELTVLGFSHCISPTRSRCLLTHERREARGRPYGERLASFHFMPSYRTFPHERREARGRPYSSRSAFSILQCKAHLHTANEAHQPGGAVVRSVSASIRQLVTLTASEKPFVARPVELR